jgi:hypothetical protein
VKPSLGWGSYRCFTEGLGAQDLIRAHEVPNRLASETGPNLSAAAVYEAPVPICGGRRYNREWPVYVEARYSTDGAEMPHSVERVQLIGFDPYNVSIVFATPSSASPDSSISAAEIRLAIHCAPSSRGASLGAFAIARSNLLKPRAWVSE